MVGGTGHEGARGRATRSLAVACGLLIVSTVASAQVAPRGYRIERRLGSGGQASVWRAREERTGRAVALRFATDVARSARAMRAIRNSRWFVEHLDTDGESYEALELLEHHVTLEQLPRPPARDAVRIVRNVLRGLSDLHAAGFVHRDVHRGNVMIDPRLGADSVRIIDFGHVHRIGEGSRSQPSVDVFGAAKILYRLITGTRAMPEAFESAEASARMLAVLEGTACSAGLRDVLRRALALDVTQRFQSAEALEQALAPYAE